MQPFSGEPVPPGRAVDRALTPASIREVHSYCLEGSPDPSSKLLTDVELRVSINGDRWI